MTSMERRSSLLLVLLTCGYCLAHLDRVLMVVVAESAKLEFGLSDKQLFLLTGAAFLIFYGVFTLMSGWLLSRFRMKLVVAATLAIWSLFTVACGIAQNFVQLAFARAGIGISESVIVPAAMALISDSYAPQRRPLATGIFLSGGMVGIFLAWMFGGWISAHYGWRYAFFLAGPPGIILAVLIARFMKDAPALRPPIIEASSPTSTYRELFQNGPFMWLVLGSSVLSFVNAGVASMLGSFLHRSHGMSLGEIGLVFGPVLAAGMACGMIGGGLIGNSLARRGPEALVSFCALIAFALFPVYTALLLTPSKNLALAIAFVGATMSTLYTPCYHGAYLHACTPHTRATAAGLQIFLNVSIGGALTPFLVGALSDYWRPEFGENSLRYAMLVGLISCLVSGLVFINARRKLRASGRFFTETVWLH